MVVCDLQFNLSSWTDLVAARPFFNYFPAIHSALQNSQSVRALGFWSEQNLRQAKRILINKQHTVGDFSPGVASWRTRRNIRIRNVFYSACHFAPLCENMTSSTHPEVGQAATATAGIIYKKFGEIWTYGF